MIADLKPYSEYKESGQPWLGMIPRHWSLQKLKHLTRFVNGLPFKPGSWCDRGVPIIRIQNLNGSNNFNYTNRRDLPQELLIRPGDLLFAWSGNRGTSFGPTIWERDFSGYLNQHIFKLDGYSLDTRYFAYVLRAVTRNIEDEKAHGIIGLVHITKPELGTTKVPIASLEEQIAIVQFLDWVNKRLVRTIRAKRKVIALLNEQKQAIIHRAVTRGLDSSVPLKPSGIPWLSDIPSHWNVRRVKQVARIVRGKFSHRPRNDASFYDGPYPFIQTGSVARAKKFIIQFTQSLNEKGLSVSRLFPKGTLCMTIAANIGDVGILDFDSCFPDSIVGFTLRPELERDFLYLAFLCMKSEFLRDAPVNTQGNLNVERIGPQCIPLPGLNEQKKILKYVETETVSLDAVITRAEREIELLREYRTRLVADVVTGKLDVREAAAKLPVDEQSSETSEELVEDDSEMIEDEITEPVA
jgi:type I restriction enzyme S subunit